MTETLRLLLADDHAGFRAGFHAALANVDDVTIVGDALDGHQAIRMAEDLQPDIVVMDLKMPHLDGIEATRRLLHGSPHIGVLVLTMFDDDDSVFLAMRAGARGYLVKGAPRDEIVRAVHAVAAGEAIVGPAIARRIQDYLSTSPTSSFPPPTAEPAFPELTPRERDVLALMAAGNNNGTIAQRLGISTKTVRNHGSNIFTKLVVTDRVQAIIRARDAGLGTGPPDSG
jgi:DNA-binding NarL/FixJ family response regulator